MEQKKERGKSGEGASGKKGEIATKAQSLSTPIDKEKKFCEKVAFAEKIWYTVGMIDAQEAIRSGETGEKFALFYAMLTAYNEKFNLTRITDREDCNKKHFLDSLSGEKYFPQGANCAEVGSGGGFPSVPLLIVRGDLRFTLLESSHKKCDFLCEVVEKLGLRARVYALRAEDAGRKEAFREAFDVCTARAVARLATLAEYCAPLIRVGGRFVAYKGRAEEELAEAAEAFDVLGLRLREKETFALEGGDVRTLLFAEKVKSTPAKYPRGKGKERSDPLGARKRSL